MPQTRKHAKSTSDVELRPDGWERFERAIGAAVKSGPQHRMTAKSAKTKRAKPRIKQPKIA